VDFELCNPRGSSAHIPALVALDHDHIAIEFHALPDGHYSREITRCHAFC
jgi:hypothetical protein